MLGIYLSDALGRRCCYMCKTTTADVLLYISLLNSQGDFKIGNTEAVIIKCPISCLLNYCQQYSSVRPLKADCGILSIIVRESLDQEQCV